MSDPYTPTTSAVREGYTRDRHGNYAPDYGASFDRWLTAHDEKVRADTLEEATTLVTERAANLPAPGGPYPSRVVSELLTDSAAGIRALATSPIGARP